MPRASLHEPVLFAVGGILGFLADSSVLLALHRYVGVDLYSGRLASFLVAVTCTWLYNRTVTFRTSHAPTIKEWIRFVIANAIGGGANFTVYAALLKTAKIVGAHPTLGVAAGAAVGYVFSFGLSKRLFVKKLPQGVPPLLPLSRKLPDKP